MQYNQEAPFYKSKDCCMGNIFSFSGTQSKEGNSQREGFFSQKLKITIIVPAVLLNCVKKMFLTNKDT